MSKAKQNIIDRSRLNAVRERENNVFASRTRTSASLARRATGSLPSGVPMSWMKGLYRTPPIFIDRGQGAYMYDVDGNAYLDFNVCDLSMTMGYGPEPIVEAVSRQIRKGAHFLLPTEDALVVGETLAACTGIPYWQFTLSASGANTEVLRIARVVTGKSKVLVFGGHYHGHIDETLAEEENHQVRPALMGLPPNAAAHTEIVPFNSLEALEETLSRGEVALVLTEPALTNCNVVLPEPGFLAGVRELTRKYGALLCYDEAHTFQFAHGGLVNAWQLEPDFIVLGKGLGTGVAFGLYGMSAAVETVFSAHLDNDIGPSGIAAGGTVYGSALAMAAARAALTQVLTPDAYRRVSSLGERLAIGLDRLFEHHKLPWTAFRLGPRSGYCLTPGLPKNLDEANASLDYYWIDTRRVFMANRGIWDAVASAGPQASLAHTDDDIDTYLKHADEFLRETVTGSSN